MAHRQHRFYCLEWQRSRREYRPHRAPCRGELVAHSCGAAHRPTLGDAEPESWSTQNPPGRGGFSNAGRAGHHVERVVTVTSDLRIRAERRVGEFLAAQPNAKTGPRRESLVADGDPTPTLDEQGITWSDLSRYQKLARVPESKFERVIEEAIEQAHATNTRRARDQSRRELAMPATGAGARCQVRESASARRGQRAAHGAPLRPAPRNQAG
jgi:hypothetical protein